MIEDTKYVYFDVETLPSSDTSLLDRLTEKASAPANYKDADKIAAYKAEKAREQFDKTSFDGWYGSVACIAWEIEGMKYSASSLDGEAAIVRTFFRSLPKSNVCLVGHNIAGFDVPFLTKRAVMLGVELPPAHVWPRDPKPWSKNVQDTMVMASGRDWISMDALCAALGIEGKGDMDGSKVAETWKTDPQKVLDYCVSDVERTRQIHQRFLAVGF